MTTGVVLMAYGTPRAPDEIEAYYTDIRRGRPPTRRAARRPHPPLRGDRRPVAARRDHRGPARRPAGGARRAPAGRFVVARRPQARRPDDRGRRGDAGGRRASSAIVGLVLAPHFSALSVGEYLGRAAAAARDAGAAVRRHRELGGRAGVRRLPRRPGPPLRSTACRRTRKVLFTAHSLPRRDPRRRRPLPRRAARDRRRRRRTPSGWRRGRSGRSAWQSAGRTPEPWIGPDVLAVIDELAAVGARRRAAGLPVRLRRRPPRGALRPRHRGPPARRARTAWRSGARRR